MTNGCRITATVAFASHQGITFYGGEGIGTVTLSGLGLDIGEPAINPAPRENIRKELTLLYNGGLDVTISIENGKDLAEKTFNPRVGVVGGLSIIGTTGIIRPFSHEAFIDCIRRELDVAIAMQCETIAVNSGGKSERFMKNVPGMVIGIMLGKAVKLAEGNMDTHSHKVTANKEYLKKLAKEAECSDYALVAIENFNLARELPSLLNESDSSRFFPKLLDQCHKHCVEVFPNKLDMVLMADDGTILSKIKS